MIYSLLAAAFALASNSQVDLPTPRGALTKIDIYNNGKSRVLLLAPGQNCSARAGLYEALASAAVNQEFTLVRLHWAYCLLTPPGQPHESLSDEAEDLRTALTYVKETMGVAEANVYIGGKSLGSAVSLSVFQKIPELPGLVLLTPVCTTAGENKFEAYYPALSAETRPVFLLQGNKDPLCHSSHFQHFLSGKPMNFVPLSTLGDHGFGVKAASGEYDSAATARNLKGLSTWLFAWLGAL